MLDNGAAHGMPEQNNIFQRQRIHKIHYILRIVSNGVVTGQDRTAVSGQIQGVNGRLRQAAQFYRPGEMRPAGSVNEQQRLLGILRHMLGIKKVGVR